MILISLCLSDIPREKIKKAENGKMYANLILSERREKGKYDETHTLAVSKSPEEREANAPTIYVGSGKLYEAKPATPVTPQQIDELPPIGEDLLPF